MNIRIQVLTHKDYQDIFCISEKTAKRWIAEDRRKLDLKRITIGHLSDLYKISFELISPKNGVKKGQNGVG